MANGPDSMKCEGLCPVVLGKEGREAQQRPVLNTLLCSPAVCDSCVLLLLEDLQSIERSFPSIRGQLVTLNASSIAWARLHGLNGTIMAIAVCGRFHITFCPCFLACWPDLAYFFIFFF